MTDIRPYFTARDNLESLAAKVIADSRINSDQPPYTVALTDAAITDSFTGPAQPRTAEEIAAVRDAVTTIYGDDPDFTFTH